MFMYLTYGHVTILIYTHEQEPYNENNLFKFC